MITAKEKSYVETVYIMGANSLDELRKEQQRHMKEGYGIIGENSINYGNHIEYNSRLQKQIVE